MILTESVVEDAALDWFRKLGYDVIGGPDMPPGVGALRADYGEVVLESVLVGSGGAAESRPAGRGAG